MSLSYQGPDFVEKKETRLTNRNDKSVCTKPKSLAKEQLGSTHSWYLYIDNRSPAVSCCSDLQRCPAALAALIMAFSAPLN